jgi:hypothetical protein
MAEDPEVVSAHAGQLIHPALERPAYVSRLDKVDERGARRILRVVEERQERLRGMQMMRWRHGCVQCRALAGRQTAGGVADRQRRQKKEKLDEMPSRCQVARLLLGEEEVCELGERLQSSRGQRCFSSLHVGKLRQLS